jgi:type III pantothenate kinase
MFLAIDAGNSNVVFSLFDAKSNWSELGRVDTSTVSEEAALSRSIASFLNTRGVHPNAIKKVGFSSVVPRINATVHGSCEALELAGNKLVQLTPELFEMLPIKVPRPQQIGADLVADGFAAYCQNSFGYSLTVDFGTALTFTLVDGKAKEIVGVNIMPGIKTALKALFTNTAQLPEISLQYPEIPIGNTTESAIRAGILYGYNGAVKEMIQLLSAQVGGNLKVFATGGMVSILTDLHPFFDVINPFLTVEGIRLIVEKVG